MLKIKDVKRDSAGNVAVDDAGQPILIAEVDGTVSALTEVIQTPIEAKGVVTLTDGTSYDVTPRLIAVRLGHEGPVCHHIELQMEGLGAIFEQTGEPFAHACSDFCGAEAVAK